MLFRHHQPNSQHVLESSETCCEERSNHQERQKTFLQRTHCLDAAHSLQRALAGRIHQLGRRRRGRGQHPGRLMSHQLHGHGHIHAALRRKPGHITCQITLHTSRHTEVLRGHQGEQPHDNQKCKAHEPKSLTFHCVEPRKTEVGSQRQEESYGFPGSDSLLHVQPPLGGEVEGLLGLGQVQARRRWAARDR
jgi:hypothetical protein